MLHRRHVLRKQPIVTRSMSQSSFMLKSDNQSGRIEKKAGIPSSKGAFREGKFPVARMHSIQKLLRQIHVKDENSPKDVFNFGESNTKFLYDHESSVESQGECECVVMGPESPIRKFVSITSSIAEVNTPTIIPINECEMGFSSASEPTKCSIADILTGIAWNPRGTVLRAVLGAVDGLHYWTVDGTRTSRRVYIFGYYLNRAWRYVTVSSSLGRIRFETNDTQPNLVDVEGEKVTDDRAFYMEGEPDSAYLIPATMENHYVTINAQHRRQQIELTEDKSLANKWRLVG